MTSSEEQDLKAAVGWLLSHQMRFNLATTKLLGKIIARETIVAADIDELVNYLKLAVTRSEEITKLIKPLADDD